MTRVLVTGGSGFIGTNIAEHYRSRQDEVWNFDVVAPRCPAHQPLWRCVDLLDKAALAQAVEAVQPDVVFHMGARTDLFGSSVVDYAANTLGVSNLIEALRRVAGLRLAVFASSMLVCRIGYRPRDEFDYCPSTAYGESKIIGEQLVRKEAGDHFPWTILRPTSIWGPWFGVPYRDFFTAVSRGLYVHPAGRRIRRNYGFVMNSVAQLARLEQIGGGSLLGKAAYLADYDPIELKDWADRIQRDLDVRPVRELPMWVFKTAAAAGDVLKRLGYALPPMSSYRLNNMLTEMIHDTTPLQSVLPELPYSLDEATHITCNWLQKRSN